MNYLQGSFYYSPKDRSMQLMKEKARLVHLKELVDTEKLQTQTLKLEAKLLALRIKKVRKNSPDLILPKVLQPIRNKSSFSQTPHPRKALHKFSNVY